MEEEFGDCEEEVNVDEGEYVGFGIAGPSWRRRALRARSGSEASRSTAARKRIVSIYNTIAYIPIELGVCKD
jgi:hypothetical protein